MSHVAFVYPAFQDASAERNVLPTAGGLAGRGHEVDVVLFERWSGTMPEGTRPIALDDWQGVSRLRLSRVAPSLLTRFPAAAPALLRRGASLRVRRLAGYFERERPDVVFANFPKAEYAAYFAAQMASPAPPVVPVLHTAAPPGSTDAGRRRYVWRGDRPDGGGVPGRGANGVRRPRRAGGQYFRHLQSGGNGAEPRPPREGSAGSPVVPRRWPAGRARRGAFRAGKGFRRADRGVSPRAERIPFPSRHPGRGRTTECAGGHGAGAWPRRPGFSPGLGGKPLRLHGPRGALRALVAVRRIRHRAGRGHGLRLPRGLDRLPGRARGKFWKTPACSPRWETPSRWPGRCCGNCRSRRTRRRCAPGPPGSRWSAPSRATSGSSPENPCGPPTEPDRGTDAPAAKAARRGLPRRRSLRRPAFPHRHARTCSGHPRLAASRCEPGAGEAAEGRGCPEQVRA